MIQNEISALTNIVKKGKISLLLKEASRPFPAPSLLLDDQDEDSLTCLAESEGRNAANISKGSELQNLESFKIQFNLVFVCLLGCFSKDTLKENKKTNPVRNWGGPRENISRRRG